MNDEIRDFLMIHRATGDALSFSDDESLLNAGVIDSVTMLDLIAHLENRYGISIDEEDLIPENFDSVSAIVTFVERRQGAGG